MKKLLGALLALALLLSLGAALADGRALTPGSIAYVNNPNPADRLNLRTGPGTRFASLGKYYNGTWVTVLDVTGDGWAHVRIDPLEGYMDAAYLTADAAQVGGQLPTVFVYNDERRSAALHSRPSGSSAVLTVYPYGSAVYNVLSVRADGWRHVYDSAYGYGFVFADVLTPKLDYHKSGSNYAYVRNPDSTDRLHLRAAPDSGAASLGKYYNGVRVLVLDDAGGGWQHVLVGSVEGYMRSTYLSASPVASAQPVVTVYNTRGTGANVRSGPSTSAASLRLAYNGETLTVLAVREDGWLHVNAQGTEGFVRGELVTPAVTWEKR